MVIAVYPGTFDPLTRGHEDLVRRAAGLFTKLIVGVADSRAKKPFFDLNERIAIAREVLSHYPNVEVAGFRGLLKDFVREQNARVIVRGLRARPSAWAATRANSASISAPSALTCVRADTSVATMSLHERRVDVTSNCASGSLIGPMQVAGRLVLRLFGTRLETREIGAVVMVLVVGRPRDVVDEEIAEQLVISRKTAGSHVEETPLPGAAWPATVPIQRLISLWRAASSRKGSQRTSAIAQPPFCDVIRYRE